MKYLKVYRPLIIIVLVFFVNWYKKNQKIVTQVFFNLKFTFLLFMTLKSIVLVSTDLAGQTNLIKPNLGEVKKYINSE